MIEQLKKLKSRAETIKYSDQKELDDIKRKTKLYLEKLFPGKISYPLEVSFISFKPSSTIYSNDEKQKENCKIAWNDGKNSLVNLIDTRIEEYELSKVKREIKFQKPIIREKIIEVENTDKILQLQVELNKERDKKSLWSKINWATLLTIGITILGGTFMFGKYIGENRFDKEKIELNSNNEKLTKKNTVLSDSIKVLNKSLKNKLTK